MMSDSDDDSDFTTSTDDSDEDEPRSKRRLPNLHLPAKEYACKRCDFKATKRKGADSIHEHLRDQHGYHRAFWFGCDRCRKSFQTKPRLACHVRQKHTGERPFPCQLCDKRFSERLYLERHHQCVHSNAPRPDECDLCPATFKRSENLNQHRNTHTGARPFQCSLCPVDFAQRHCRDRHEMSHRGEKPYECELCPKAFVQKNALDNHVRSHTGERPFRCRACPAAYTQRTALVLHARKKHGVGKDWDVTPAVEEDGGPVGVESEDILNQNDVDK